MLDELYENKEKVKYQGNIEIKGHVGTWYVIDKKKYDDRWLYLLEHEIYGDEAACLIVDDENKVVVDDIWNGFRDYENLKICKLI